MLAWGQVRGKRKSISCLIMLKYMQLINTEYCFFHKREKLYKKKKSHLGEALCGSPEPTVTIIQLKDTRTHVRAHTHTRTHARTHTHTHTHTHTEIADRLRETDKSTLQILSFHVQNKSSSFYDLEVTESQTNH